MDMTQLGALIRFHRKQSGLSQKELGRLGGCGKTVVFDVEKGKLSIRLDSLLKILHVLNIKIEFRSPLMGLFEENLDEKG